MRWVRGSRLTILAVVLVVAGLVPAQPAASAAARPSSEIGVTPSEIRIAIVADVENPIVPGVFRAVVDGAEGFARYINSRGGLAGRKVVVDFMDSKLNAAESRNAMISACANDFVVLSAALFLNNVDDVESCRDAAGADDRGRQAQRAARE